MSNKVYEVIVIGGGPGGYAAAIRAGQLGLKTLVIEKEKVGGTCLNVGCIPTKAFVKCASRINDLKEYADMGIDVTYNGLNLKAFQDKKSSIVKRLNGGVEALLKMAKVDLVYGEASFKDAKTVVAKTADGEEVFQGKNIILAVGTRPKALPFAQFDGKSILSSTDALALDVLPKSMAVIGAGVVGMEFASIFSQLGVKVTVLEALPTILPTEDAEVTALLQQTMTKQGVTFKCGVKVLDVEKKDENLLISIEDNGKKERILAEKLLVAAGRQPNTDMVGIENTGVKMERGYVVVDDHMQTNVPGFYAIGDVTPSIQLAHVAYDEGYVAAENIAGEDKKMSYAAIPRCIYTAPEISGVGLTEAQAKEKYKTVKTYTFPFSAVGKALIEGAGEGFAKVIVDEEYGEILGFAMIGHGVGDLIAGPTIAMSLESTIETLADVVLPHPSLSEIVKEVSMKAVGRPLHMKK